MVRAIRVAMFIALLGTLARASDDTTTSSPTTSPTTSPAETVKVKRGALKLAVTAGGAFEPIDPFEVRLRFKAYQGDLIVVSAVAPGAQVAKGDVVLQLDDRQVKRQLAQAESDRDSAKANLQKAQSDVALGDSSDALALKIQNDEVKNAEAALKWWENVDGKQILEAADLAVQYGKDSVEDQEDELEQLKKMYKSEELTNATADIVVKRALRALKHAKVSLGMTEERSKKTKENDYEVGHARMKYAVDQQKQALDQLKAQQAQVKVQRAGALTTAKLALESAEERVADMKSDFAQFAARAPESMTIYYGQLVNGSWQNSNPKLLRPGEKIVLQPPHLLPGAQMTGCLPGKLKFVANVPEDKILLVQRGQKAEIVPSAMPQKPIEGTVTESVRVVGESASYDVAVELPSDVPELAPGMKASLKIKPSVEATSLLVPVAALKDDKIWVHQSDGTDKETEVLVGRSDGEMVEIVRGVSEGDEVLAQAKK